MTLTANFGPAHFDSEEEFWKDIEESFVLLEGFLCMPVESREQAEENIYGSGLGHNANDLFPLVVTYRQTDNREQLQYYHSSGLALLDTVCEHVKKRKITPEFLTDWAQISFCAGFVANSAYAIGNDLNDVRAGQQGAKAVSVDDKRIWFSKMYKREYTENPKYKKGNFQKTAIRSEIEADIEALILDIIESPEKYPECSSEWFRGFLNDKMELKSTYNSKKLSQRRILEEFALVNAKGLPPLDLEIPIPKV